MPAGLPPLNLGSDAARQQGTVRSCSRGDPPPNHTDFSTQNLLDWCGRLRKDLRSTPNYGRLHPHSNTASTCTHNAYVGRATTGKAAVAIGGLTVHAAFKLSMRADGGLRDGDLNSFRTAFTNVKCVIVGECSMMSSDTLARVDDRLRQVTGNYNDPFGGLDFIMCGDLRQRHHT
ncbi:hypothetical protein HPB49_003300 [Dermacentor silvarum]|uniref:Uncharacterized protein n=1 Tax=Dermacentor silvarum TaxID=543639 RepID=A0ACB8DB12_DERSI|nr:hypothetical protein HPB49_003300 [Dermacentor silvarum]